MRSDIIRPYLEKLIGQWLEVPVIATDDQGRYHVRVGTSGFIVELVDFEPTLVRMWSPVVMGIEKSVELLETLNGLNGNGLGLRVFYLDEKVILATELVALYGGATLFEPRDDLADDAGDPAAQPLMASGGFGYL